MVDFGSKLKMLRMTKGLTQIQLGNILDLTKSMISAYEMGSRYPSYSSLIKIAAYFGVTTDFLLGADINQGIDISGLSEANMKLIINLIQALKEKQ